MQIKATVRSPVRMTIIKRIQITNIGEGMEQRKHLYTFGGDVNCFNHYGKLYGGSSKNYHMI